MKKFKTPEDLLRSRVPAPATKKFLEKLRADQDVTPAALDGAGLRDLSRQLQTLHAHYDALEDDFEYVIDAETDPEIANRIPEYGQKIRAAKACIVKIREELRRLARISRKLRDTHVKIADPVIEDPPIQ